MSRPRAAARVAVAAAVALLVVVAAGCGDEDDARGSGPGGLPAGFPVPAGAEARFSMAGGGELTGGLQVELAVPGPPGEVRAWYAERLPEVGYEVTDDGAGPLGVRGHGRVGTLTVAAADGGTSTVRVALEPA